MDELGGGPETPTLKERIEQRRAASVWFRLLFPVVLYLVFEASAILTYPDRWKETTGFLVAYHLPPAGKESILPAMVARDYSPFLAAIFIAGSDLITGLWFAWNFDLLVRAPVIGPRFQTGLTKTEGVLARNPWLERSAFVGTTLFMAVPLQGTGAISASIVGRLLGMKPYRTFLAVSIGGLSSSFAIAYAAAILVAQGAVGTYILIAIVAALLVLGWLWARAAWKKQRR
ncbi:MAG: small multi-drug export protein [Methanobacteriota archaeon]